MSPMQASPFARSRRTESGSLPEVLNNLAQNQIDLRVLTSFLEEVVATEAETNENAQLAKIEGIIQQYGKIIGGEIEEIAGRMNTIRGLSNNPDLAPYSGDIEKIFNLWKRVEANDLFPLLKVVTPKDMKDLVRVRNMLNICKQLRREIGLFTIPKRIWEFTAERAGVGAELDFHKRFKDELEEGTDRVLVLSRLAELEVDAVGGMVDVGRGMIYRVGAMWRRVASYFLILGTSLVGFGVVFLLKQNGALDTVETGSLLTLYLFLMLGVIIHIIKKVYELARIEQNITGTQEGIQDIVLDRLFLWIHVREFRFIVSVIIAVVVFIALGFDNQLDYIKAFLAGYSVDSFSDLILQRFNAKTSEYTKDIQKSLQSASSST